MKIDQGIKSQTAVFESELEAIQEKLDLVIQKLEAGRQEKEFYSTQEYAAEIGVTSETVRKNYIETADIKAIKCSKTRHWLIPHSEMVKARNRPKFLRA